jgi:uncharacterized protein
MKQLQLTIYLNEADMAGDIALHEWVIRRLLQAEIAGATAFMGVMGFGKHHQVHRQRLFGFSDDRPVIVIAVDEEARIRAVIPELRHRMKEGMMTLQDVEVVVVP